VAPDPLPVPTEQFLFWNRYTAALKLGQFPRRQTPPLPEKIPPLSPEDELVLISVLMTEFNENYALNLYEYPSLTRCSEPEIKTLTEVGRVFAIGASYMKRIVGGLVSKNLEVLNLSRSGWKSDKDTIPESARKFKEYNLKSSDTVIIDPVSNSVFCGTDESGNLVNPEKDESGTWHIVGELAFRPKTVLKKILTD
jgi:hypothetical protein